MGSEDTLKLTLASHAPILLRRLHVTSTRWEALTTETLNGFDTDLKSISSLLTSIAARILQVSDKKASLALGAATNAIAGSAFVAAVT